MKDLLPSNLKEIKIAKSQSYYAYGKFKYMTVGTENTTVLFNCIPIIVKQNGDISYHLSVELVHCLNIDVYHPHPYLQLQYYLIF